MHKKTTPTRLIRAAIAGLALLHLTASAQVPYTDVLAPIFNGAALRGVVEDVTLEKFGNIPASDSTEGERLVHRGALFQLATNESETPMLVCAERVYLMTSDAGNQAAATNSSPLDVLDRDGGKLVFATAMSATQAMAQFRPGQNPRQTPGMLPLGVQLGEELAPGLFRLTFTPKTPQELHRTLNSVRALSELVEFAEPDFIGRTMSTTPNDTNYSLQWNLPRISVPDAWDSSTGGDAVIAVLDTGIVSTHADLSSNIWVHPVDNTKGWNFVNNNSNTTDTNGHGTHVAGVVGAIGNNSKGVAGVCWNVKLMPLKVATSTTVNYSYAISALTYIRNVYNTLGIRVVAANHSWGGTSYSQGLFNAVNNSIASGEPLPPDNAVTATWSSGSRVLALSGSPADLDLVKPTMRVYKYPEIATSIGTAPVVLLKYVESGVTYITLSALPHNATGTNVPLAFSNPMFSNGYGTLHVTAAGDGGTNTDLNPIFPACFPSDLIVNVGGSSKDSGALEKPYTTSAYGKYSVHLFAPGQEIWSTSLTAYQQLSGCSFAAPHVCGALALFLLTHPTATEYDIRPIILQSGFDQPVLFDQKCTTNGRLNVKSLVDAIFP
jgi:subtilisin family serine protease